MSEAEEVTLNIKFVINKEKNKVLFAEAGSDFTDVLLSFLLLPLGKIVNILEKHYGDEAPVIGSLNTLYKGVANLDSFHFSREAVKNNLLGPYVPSEFLTLKLNYTNLAAAFYSGGKLYDGTITKTAASFIISDDLRVLPNVLGSIIETLSYLDIDVADMDGAETRNTTLGFNEVHAFILQCWVQVMALLKEILTSRDHNPLTTLLLDERATNSAAAKSKVEIKIDKKDINMNGKKMSLRATIQKSTNKFLFAQADHEFVNFLFGLLILPLGAAESYLGSNTGLDYMDNLHRSIAAGNLGSHLMIKGDSTNLAKPFSDRYSNEFYPLNFDREEGPNHVDGSRMYMVRDDLTVVPLGITSTLSHLKELDISLSDVKEVELHVRLEEGLSIVKAALTSTTVLTDTLIEPMLKEQVKEESPVDLIS